MVALVVTTRREEDEESEFKLKEKKEGQMDLLQKNTPMENSFNWHKNKNEKYCFMVYSYFRLPSNREMGRVSQRFISPIRLGDDTKQKQRKIF